MRTTVLLLLSTLFVSAEGFCRPLPERAALGGCLSLHPDQAKELEACAYDHWKELAENGVTMEPPKRLNNPAFEWCKKILANKASKSNAVP